MPAARQHLLRKKGPAPPPPNPFGSVEEEGRPLTDIYEKVDKLIFVKIYRIIGQYKTYVVLLFCFL